MKQGRDKIRRAYVTNEAFLLKFEFAQRKLSILRIRIGLSKDRPHLFTQCWLLFKLKQGGQMSSLGEAEA
jgi:hypothetical protein